ncbi:hypothetical protein [Mucilaginibacter sp.]|jgi:hypothetical protein|uniref:hypothetical protein n=1 Tax=Mucilaginibacter sp. TaxID=1882438 RepID=UPI00356443CB
MKKFNEKDETKMFNVLVNNFGYPEVEAEQKAKDIINILNGEPSCFTLTDKALPELGELSDPSQPYYIIRVQNYGEHRAMYLRDANGESGWYSSYIAKIVAPVLSWRKSL